VNDPKWQFLTSAPNLVMAHTLIDFLEAGGIPCQIVSGPALLGECQDCHIIVKAPLLHQAKWLLAQGSFTDEELTILATEASSDDGAKT
jgi:hypothetical protein